MLIHIAWRNIWRSRRRSLILITAIMMGLWGGLFAAGIITGMTDSLVNSAIDRDLSHLQLHAQGFREERLISQVLTAPHEMIAAIRKLPAVHAVVTRTLIEGMASSPTSATGVRIVGIVPSDERQATSIARRMSSGVYFDGAGRMPAVIGKKLSEKLDLKLKSKLVLSFQRPDGTIMYAAFRVTGIYDTESTPFDGSTVFVTSGDLDGLLGVHLVHEIAVRLTTNDSLASVQRRLAVLNPGIDVASWRELAPEVKLTAESSGVTSTIFLAIILLALLFGVTNTMLMSVMDRVREFGVLMAVGMKRRRIFLMIILETLYLSLAGSIAGTLLGAATLAWAGNAGINLAWFSEGLSLYGMSTMLYPAVHPATYLVLAGMVAVATVLAALYPAAKAVMLNPATALTTYG